MKDHSGTHNSVMTATTNIILKAKIILPDVKWGQSG